MLFTHVFSLSCVVYPPCPSLWQNEVGERYVFFAAMNDTTPTSEAQDNSSLLDLLDDAVASQLTTSALVTKIRELLEENAILKAELQCYRERDEVAHDVAPEEAAPWEPPRELRPRDPPREPWEPPLEPALEPALEPTPEPPLEPPLTPRTSTACGVTPQEWMGMYPYRHGHHTPSQASASPRISATDNVPVHMWRSPRTTLPRHPLSPARSLTPNTVVRPARAAAAGTLTAAMRAASMPQPGGLEGKLAGPPSSPYDCPLFLASFREPPDSSQGRDREPSLELTAVAGGARLCLRRWYRRADGRGAQSVQSPRALLEVKADLEKQTAKALCELRERHGDQLSAQWWVRQAAGGSDYYCALLEAGAHKDPNPSR